jgi:hypothetical protein
MNDNLDIPSESVDIGQFLRELEESEGIYEEMIGEDYE